MSYLLPFFLALSLFPNSSYGQVNIDLLKKGAFLGTNLQILRSKKKLTILEAVGNRNFSPAQKEIPRFGYVYDDIWAKLDVDNPSDQNEELFFEFRGPIEWVTSYLVKNNNVIDTAKAGMFIFPEDESFVSGHSYPVISFRIPPGTSTLYFSETAVAPHFPIVSYDRAGFENRKKFHSSILNLFFGISVTFLLILTMIFLFINGTCQVFLVLSFISFLLLMGFVTGMFRVLYYNYGGSKDSILSYYMQFYPVWPLFFSFFCLFISLFSIFHLGKENFFKSIPSRVLTWIALLSQMLLGVVSCFDTVLAMNLFSAGFNITIGQAVYWAMQKYRSGRKEEILTVIGWLIYGGLTTLQLCYFLGFADNTFFAVWGTVIGFFALLTLLTFSLVERNKRILDQTLIANEALEKLRRTQEISASLGQLAAQAAHDIRSPLSALTYSLQDVSDLPQEKQAICTLSINRIKEIADVLLTENRKRLKEILNDQVTTEPSLLANDSVSLGHLIEEMVIEKRTLYSSKTDLRIQTDLSESNRGISVRINGAELKRVLSNLIDNSVEALPQGGHIIISIVDNGPYTNVLISDNGIGIPAERLSRLGSPGATFGKPNGTGLGLYHARQLLESAGGNVQIESTLNEGTTVTLRLPKDFSKSSR